MAQVCVEVKDSTQGKYAILEQVDTPYPETGWVIIPNSGGCMASDEGEIKSRRGKILSQWREKGTWRVRLNGRNRSVSFLVLSAFSGLPLCDGYFPRHRNKDRSDNSKENLLWAGKGTG